MTNYYYHPEEYGFSIIVELELGECYEFDTHFCIVNEANEIYYGHDAGCSCPTPFDGMQLSDFDKIDKNGFESFSKHIMELDCPLADKREFLDKIFQRL